MWPSNLCVFWQWPQPYPTCSWPQWGVTRCRWTGRAAPQEWGGTGSLGRISRTRSRPSAPPCTCPPILCRRASHTSPHWPECVCLPSTATPGATDSAALHSFTQVSPDRECSGCFSLNRLYACRKKYFPWSSVSQTGWKTVWHLLEFTHEFLSNMLHSATIWDVMKNVV